MSEQRRQILEMLAAGQINADEAERLIAALEREPQDAPSPAEPRRGKRPRYLRVVVDDRDAADPTHVNVRVPLQLLRAGVRLASLVPPRALDELNEKLQGSGVPVDLRQLKPEHIEELVEQLDEMTVEVQDTDSHVRLFCE